MQPYTCSGNMAIETIAEHNDYCFPFFPGAGDSCYIIGYLHLSTFWGEGAGAGRPVPARSCDLRWRVRARARTYLVYLAPSIPSTYIYYSYIAHI